MSTQRRSHSDSASVHVYAHNPFTASAGLSPTNYDVYVRRGRLLQAQAVARGVRTAGRGVLLALRAALAWYRRRRAIHDAERTLRALDPRLLRDIGIEAHQIPAVARGAHVDAERSERGVADVTPLPPRADAPCDPCFDRAA